MWDDQRLRDQIALLEVDIVALEMLVLRCCLLKKSGRTRSTSRACSRSKGSEIQQRYAELMMLAAGPLPCPSSREAMEAGWQAFPGGEAANARWHPPTSTCARPPFMVAMGSAMKCSGNIRSDRAGRPGDKPMDFDFSDDQQSLRDAVRPGWTRATPSSAAAASSPQGQTHRLWRTG